MNDRILINSRLSLDAREVRITATRSSGPGGQNVNRVATRVTLRFNVERSSALTEEQKALIRERLAGRVAKSGDLVLHEERGRTQGTNRKLALEKFREIIAGALKKRKKRVATSAGPGEKEKRLRKKKFDGEKKRMRRHVEPGE